MIVDRSLLRRKLVYALNRLPERIQDLIILASKFYYGKKNNAGYREKIERMLLDNRSSDVHDLEQYQLENLKSIIAHAWSNSIGYRNYWEEQGFKPDDVKELSDIKKIPVITKEIMAKRIEDFSVENKSPNARFVTTSGSTGTPFGFYMDDDMAAVDAAFTSDLRSRFGYEPDDRYLIVRGGAVGGGYIGSEHIEISLLGSLSISSYTLSAYNVRIYLSAIERYRPAFIFAYPSSIELLTSFFIKAGINRPCDIKFIHLSSENLYQSQKQMIEDYWECPIINHYGMAERAVLAANIHGGDVLFTIPEYGITEILDDDNKDAMPGESGYIVGTSFHMKQTPFIRYRSNDIAIREATSCSKTRRSNLAIRQILGRDRNFIQKMNGDRIPFAMALHDDYLTEFDEFQFCQKELNRLEFRYVSDHIVSEDVLETLKQKIREKFGAEFILECKRVERIERGPNAKYSYFVGLEPSVDPTA